MGATVTDLHGVGRGCPDLLVGYQGANYLLEVKTTHGRLTPAERSWLESWCGSAAVVCDLETALGAIGLAINCKLAIAY